MEKKNRSTGERASPGYPPPCPGGRGNVCFAMAKVADSNRKMLAKAGIELGTY